ncbi:hypothetical protein O1O06_15005 [Grimontia hollisae]|uniref:hypothetical protein n=1 Tax=Grimontia hollisae TaxID=673 RepID=UPI0023DABC5A|nr:hypothetical protein [Grimontia hollisae]MDF2186050.1 hypothetical protein [Grimontia hollisae]
MTKEKEYTRPTYLEVSSHFLHDAIDFKIRYRYCIDSDGPLFYEPKSRRTKCFVDLRMGIESALKAIVCYYTYNERKGKTLVNWIEKFGHDVGKMVRKLDGEIPVEVLEPFKDDLLKLDLLPVGLRYRFDTWNFKDNKEALYYDTIGCDRWLESLYKALEELIEHINSKLTPHSRIVSMAEVFKEMQEPRFEKYT